MKAKILAGAVAAILYGGVALAEDCPPKQDTQAQQEQSGTSSGVIIGDQALPSDVNQQNQGLGGSGTAGTSTSSNVQGQSQQQLTLQQGQVLLRCTPLNNNAGVGGSGLSSNESSSFSSGTAALTPPPQEYKTEESYKTEQKKEEAVGGSGMEQKKHNDTRGLTLLIGGGIEGYTSALAPDINPGPAVNVTAALKPTSVLGLELSYTGAANNVDASTGGGRSGPDIVRNGGQAAATFGLMASAVQPYVLGGIGVSNYNVRFASDRFRDDTVGNVPVGVGVRTHMGHFTADARVNYNFLFDQEFDLASPSTGTGAPGNSDFNKGGSYLGTINVGATF